MFFNDSYLTSFDVVNLSSLKDGYMMFNAVPLKSFNCDLSSLEVGMGMFGNTSFDSASVKRILDTIKIHDTQRGIEIGINTSQPDLFAKEIGYNNIYDLELAFSRKGWTAYFLYNPEMSATYGLRNQNSFSIYAKLIEATSPIEKRAAKYMSQDGNKSYILHWYNSSANNEGYTQFNSLEEAIEHFNIKPIERN